MIKWFHNLKVAQKLALISVLFLVPDSIMLYLFITGINENIHFGQLEQVGNQYQRPLERLLELIPQHRLAGCDGGTAEAALGAAEGAENDAALAGLIAHEVQG